MSGTAQSIATWLLKAVLASRRGLDIPSYKFSGKPISKLTAKLKKYSSSIEDIELEKYVGNYGWNHNPLKIYQYEGKLYALIEWFFLYPLSKKSDNIYNFPSWSLYKYESIKFIFQNGKKSSMAVIGNGNEGVVFKRVSND